METTPPARLILARNCWLTLSPVIAFVHLADMLGAGPDERKTLRSPTSHPLK